MTQCGRLTGRLREICEDTEHRTITPEKRAKYLRLWTEAGLLDGTGTAIVADGAAREDKRKAAALACVHRGGEARKGLYIDCVARQTTKPVSVYSCALHGECTLRRITLKDEPDVRACSKCRDRAPDAAPPPRPAAVTAAPQTPTPAAFIPSPPVGGFLYTSFGKKADFLRDSYRGATCFLLCGGPSLAKADRKLLEQRGLLVASVNNAGIAHARPQLAFMVDAPGRFHPGIWLDPGVLKFLRRDEDRKTIRLPAQPTGWRKTGMRPAECPSTYLYNVAGDFSLETFLTCERPAWQCQWTDERTGKRHVKRSVWLVAVRMLYWLGVRRIYLVGADFYYRPKQTYAFAGCDKAAQACGPNNTTMGVINEWMTLLRPRFEAAGFRVYNTTQDSRLKAFDHVPLARAVAAALDGFPAGSSCDGLYSGE